MQMVESSNTSPPQLTKASEAQDPIGVFLDGTQYANDANGQRLTAISSYVQPPDAITPLNSDTSYPDSSPPLLFGVPATQGSHTLVLAACDFSDESYDTGFMINIQGYTDCNQPIKINYVTTTTTVSADVATSTTSTIKASGTVSGTYIVTVQAEPVTTTTAEETTTTTAAESTTTTEAGKTTEPETTTTTEADTTTTTEVEATTTTQSDTETTTMDMSTTSSSSTSTKETGSTTSSKETTQSTPTTTATETISRTEESTTTSLDVSSLTPTTVETQSPVIGSTTTSVTIPSVATTTSVTNAEETESRTESSSSEEVTQATTSIAPLASTITSMEVSRASTAPSSTVDQTASQSSVGARNLRTIDQSCDAADSISGDVLVPNDRCDLLYPGNPTLFCGGDVAETQRRRAISFSRLLMLYEKQADVSISSGLSTATDEITSSGPAITSLALHTTVATETGISLSSEPVIVVPTSTEDRLPLTYPTIGTVHLTNGFNYTRTAVANEVNAAIVTLGYTPCNCDDQI
ncbi:hypothetical protein HG530_001500 [Fusarium avenaceum]|nr:hypothetical protein HG530_001500 [Fusarium avenaceum]